MRSATTDLDLVVVAAFGKHAERRARRLIPGASCGAASWAA
jgi:hypothetical protein